MNLIVELIKYLMILLMGIYTYYSFNVFRYRNKRRQNRAYHSLTGITFIIHFIGYATLLLQKPSIKLVLLYGGEVLLFILVLVFYQVLYPKISRLLVRNMLMLLAVGFLVLTRLSFNMAVRQVIIVAISFLLCIFIPYAIKAFQWLRRFGWLFGIIGVILLLVVLVAGRTSRGATNWLYIAGYSIQPSEFVKLLFVISIAALFQEGFGFRRVLIVSVMAGTHVLVLVAHRDLGGALIFFVTYIFMLYTATAKPLYLFSGLLAGSAAAIVAYKLFGHVRVRVLAWKNPFGYIDKEGYQITQSLFAIGTGGWFGMGINRGLPTDIPVVESDFIFSAISEELGGLFAICVILIFASCFVMFINIALDQEDTFYRLIAIGFSVMFAFQVILSIGGVIKFIPSTGVTLPLVSQGGTSILTTIMMFMILQGVHMKGKAQKKEAQAEISAAAEMEEIL